MTHRQELAQVSSLSAIGGGVQAAALVLANGAL
jgi:hypothetical protein